MLKNLKIRTKLTLLAILLIAFTAAVGALGERAFTTGEQAIRTLYDDRVAPLRDLKVIADMYAVNVVDSAHKVRAGTMTAADALKGIREARDTIKSKWDAYLATYLVDKEKELVAQAKPRMLAADEAIEQLATILKAGKGDELATFVSKSLYPAIDPVSETMSALVELQITVADETVKSTTVRFHTTSLQMLALIILAMLLGAAASWYVIRSITVPLAYARNVIDRMAAGDLSVEVKDSGQRDESGQMIRAAADISTTLKAVSHDLGELIEAARAGTLSVRADPSRHKGEFAQLVSGANSLLATLAEPLHEVAAVMAKLAAGDIRGRMTGEYSGELRALKGNVNRSLDVLVTTLDAVSAFAAALADGNMTHTIEGSFQGEFAAMKMNLNKAAAQLKSVLLEVRETTAQVSVSAGETTAAAVEVSRHASGQMTTLVDVSGAIEQTAAAIGEIASSADRARALARQAVEAAGDGQSTLTELSGAVHGIAEKNARITQISELIGSIADKTYVLALNAGLEAARAGESGGGFGLIAHKISSLAEEVAQATRDIRALVQEATDSVNAGVSTTAQAKSSMGRIVDMSRQSGDTIQSIAAAIEEQSSMAQLLKDRVVRLQTVGQTTASAAEEISATMKSLAGMAQHLKSETDRIRTA